MHGEPRNESRQHEPDPVEIAWAAVEAAWESPEAHHKFLALCDSLDRLGDAGRRYRIVKESNPARRAEAERRIEQVLGLAMARMRNDRREPSKARSRIEWIALGLSLVLLYVALLSLVRMSGR